MWGLPQESSWRYVQGDFLVAGDKEEVIDGRTLKEIKEIAQRDISQLTDKQWERITKDPVKRANGGTVRGFSPIARPQRFKGTF